MERNVVLYLSGGTMRGVFGAGVVTTLQDLDIYDRIEAVYGSSAGLLTAEYYLARQTPLGSSIFYEDLIKGFISLSGFWGGIADRITCSVLGRDFANVRDALNVSLLFDVVRKKKRLDVESLEISAIPLWGKVLDIRRGRPKYLSARDHGPILLAEASVAMVPYVHTPVIIDGVPYGDASIVDPIGFEELRRRHPSSKLIVVFSGDPHFKFVSRLKNHIEGFFAFLMYGYGYYDLFASAYQRLREDLAAIRKDQNALLLAPPLTSPTLTRTCDPVKLLATYEMGKHAGKAVGAFLRE